MKFLINDLGRDKVTFARNGFAESAQKQATCLGEVAHRHSTQPGCRICAGGEERGGEGAVVSKFSFTPSLCAVRACMLGVRRADREVKVSLGVAQGGGEDIRSSQVGARDEPRDLRFSRAVARLSRCVHQRGDRVVAARGFAQRSAGRVGQGTGPGIRSGTIHGFARPSAAQAQADRGDVLLGHQHSTVMRVQAPHPRVIDLGVPKFLQSCASQERSCSCTWSSPRRPPVSTQVVMRAWIFKRSQARGRSSSPSPSSGVMPQECLRGGDAWSCKASSVPERTLRQRSSRSAKASFVGSVATRTRGLHRCARHAQP